MRHQTRSSHRRHHQAGDDLDLPEAEGPPNAARRSRDLGLLDQWGAGLSLFIPLGRCRCAPGGGSWWR